MTERTILGSSIGTWGSPMNISPPTPDGNGYNPMMSPESNTNFAQMNSEMRRNGLGDFATREVSMNTNDSPPSIRPPMVSKATVPWNAKGYFKASLKTLLEKNTDFRRVVHTGNRMQTVIMFLEPNEVIDREVHEDTDQILIIQDGVGYAEIVDPRTGFEEVVKFSSGDLLVIPMGTTHQVTATTKVKLISIYGPPEHPDRLVQREK